MAQTSIQWTDHSINPIRLGLGHYCQKISPGCMNCYASRMQPRFKNQQFGGVGSAIPQLLTNGVTNGQMLWFDETKLREVLDRKKPTKYFWCDMTDLFGDWVPDDWIGRCFRTMFTATQHVHQVLTKRADRMLRYCADRWGTFNGKAYPMPPNIWLGVSVEGQARKPRIDQLRATPAAVRFLSLEPLLEDLGELDLAGIHWAIIGGESGPRARPCQVEWVRSSIKQCQAAGVPVFVKQLGSRPVINDPRFPAPCKFAITNSKGGDPSEWPADLRIREFPTAH